MDFSDHDEGDEEEEESQSMEEIPPNLPNTIPSIPSPKPFSSTSLPQPQKPTNSTPSFTRYRECLKNHAVNIGGHAVDGCGEFMASGEEGTLDALRCAACNCHRNFHRKEPSNLALPSPNPNNPPDQPLYNYNQHQHPQFSPYYRTPAGYLHHHHLAAAAARPMMPLALPSTSGGHSRDEGDDMSHPMGMMGLGGTGGMMGLGGSSGSGSGKKRFRTKFSQEQKDKMLAFAERVGWRIQKHDEQAVQQFCNEINVKRHVLKVWMHNNKHTLGKKP